MYFFEASSKEQEKVEKDSFKSTDTKTHREKYFAKKNMLKLLKDKEIPYKKKLEIIIKNSKKGKRFLDRMLNHSDDIYGKVKREVENIYNKLKY